MTETVEVVFDPPRTVKELQKCYVLSAEGEPPLSLPISQTKLTLEETPTGVVATGAHIPLFIAEDRGLVHVSSIMEDNTMTRHDWFLLGATLAMVIQGRDDKMVVWEARKMAKLLEDAR